MVLQCKAFLFFLQPLKLQDFVLCSKRGIPDGPDRATKGRALRIQQAALLHLPGRRLVEDIMEVQVPALPPG